MKLSDKKNAFTIVELVVAMGLLVMLVGLSSMVFTTTVKAHRKATASIEITRNLRVLTDQLSADFRGLRKDAPLLIAFNRLDTDGDGTADTRFDTLHFFADGDFQSTRQYPYDSNGDGVFENNTVTGNVARVYYGHANSAQLDTDTSPPAVVPILDSFKSSHLLSRKCHILTADMNVTAVYGEIPLITDAVMYTPFDTSFGLDTFNTGSPPKAYLVENALEFNTITLAEWLNALNYLDGGTTPLNADHFITACMDDNSRPYIDWADYETLHLLMAQGVLEFSVQWAYTSDDLVDSLGNPLLVPLFEGVRWWPSTDPAGTEIFPSDFSVMNGGGPFGVCFTMPNGTTNTDWYAVGQCRTGISARFSSTFYPKALKFTFRLKDANNRFPDGKTFTHIVYLDI